MQRIGLLAVIGLAVLGLGCESGTTGETDTTTSPPTDEDTVEATADVLDDAAVPPDEDTPAPIEPAGCAAIGEQCKAERKGCELTADGPECVLCALGTFAAPTPSATCEPLEGEAHYHEFESVTLEPGEEHSGWCQSFALNNPEPLWVNAVELDTDGGYHHSNWFFVPQGKVDYPSGLWKGCYNKGFHELDAATSGGVLFAQSTQVNRETQKFPDGVAVRIPPYSIVIGATHVLNFHAEPMTTGLRMTIHTIDEAEVVAKLAPFRLSYLDLNLPAGRKVDVTGTCKVAPTYEAVGMAEFEPNLYWVLPHYHGLGSGFRLELTGGERDGEEVFNLGGFQPEPFGKIFEQPLSLAGATGFRFTCSYNNTFDKQIKWGIGDNEMCVMLGFWESPLAMDISVLETKESEDDGDVIRETGPCVVVPIPYDQNKEGGLPE